MVTGFAHICFTTANLETSVAFYRDVLGFTPAFDFVNDKGETFGAYLHIGGRSFIELFRGNSVAPTDQQAYKHLCLEVDDVEATVADLRAKGLETTDPVLGDDHSWQAWLSDPDGNRIELHGYTAESKQAPWLK